MRRWVENTQFGMAANKAVVSGATGIRHLIGFAAFFRIWCQFSRQTGGFLGAVVAPALCTRRSVKVMGQWGHCVVRCAP